MRVVHVLRKPLSEGTVAANTLKHGCGGLNIDASRVAGVWSDPNPRQTDDMRGGNYGGGHSSGYREGHFSEQHSQGRWPANLILQHLDECCCVGTKKVKAIRTGVRDSRGRTHSKYRFQGEGTERTDTHVGFAGDDGKETVANWICVEGCPVASLDQQSGESLSSGDRIGNKDGGHIYGGGKGLIGDFESGDPGYGDKGGASRFFKQVGGGVGETP